MLNDILDITITNIEREKNVGSFSVDLVGEDENGNTIVIENQLEKSDHSHLGQLITYLTNLEAKTAIWIVSDPRAEHIKAVSWLNEMGNASFYLLKIEAIQIEESKPAPLLTVIVEPSVEAVEAGKAKKELAERQILRKEFWQKLLEHSKTKTKLHAGISPNIYSWIGTGAGIAGVGLNYSVRQHNAQVELYIDKDKETGDGNNEIFQTLLENKDEIEKTFGGQLNWEPLEQKRACRISKVIAEGGWKDTDKWDVIHEQMVDTMISFEKAIRPFIKKL